VKSFDSELLGNEMRNSLERVSLVECRGVVLFSNLLHAPEELLLLVLSLSFSCAKVVHLKFNIFCDAAAAAAQ
jgi:hypothetical protein